jgi:hypothetical protein
MGAREDLRSVRAYEDEAREQRRRVRDRLLTEAGLPPGFVFEPGLMVVNDTAWKGPSTVTVELRIADRVTLIRLRDEWARSAWRATPPVVSPWDPPEPEGGRELHELRAQFGGAL